MSARKRSQETCSGRTTRTGAIRQFDGNGCLQRERAEAQNGFCVEPGSLIVKMDRKRLTVGDRGELGQFVHGVKLNGIFSHGKSSCNGLYNRGGIRYNKAAKRQWTTDRSFKKQKQEPVSVLLLFSINEKDILYYPQKIQTFFVHNL